MTKCKLCQERKTFAEHHFDGEEIHLENLSDEKREKYERLEEELDEVVDVCTICHSEIHGNEAKWDPIKLLFKLRKDLIEERKATNNRIRNLQEYELDVSDLQEVTDHLSEKIKSLKKRLKKEVRKREIWQKWMSDVTGIGEVNAAGIIANLNDIGDFDTISKLWKYCGLMPKSGLKEDGKYENYQHYRQATKDLRSLTAYDIGQRFIQAGGYYREVYEERREETEADERFGDPEEEKGHYYADARRIAVKMFLSHLWQVWREIKGYEVTEPYVLEQDGHNRKRNPPHWSDSNE